MRTGIRLGVVVVGAGLALGTIRAQDETYGREYAFDDRKPKTAVEKVIAQRLPSLVKVHGASGLSTITAYATGVIVSEQGHILTLDQIMIQKDKTRVVLHDGSVYLAKLYPSERKLGVRMLKIDPKGKKLTPIAPAPRTDYRHGTFVVSLGNSFRLAEFSEKMSATFGVITARAKTGLRYRMADVDYDGELLITDAPNNPGHYGGALFTLTGDWIGLNTRIVESRETNTQISAAIPTWDLGPYIQRMVTGVAPAEPDVAEVREVYHGIRLFERGLRRSPPAYVERVDRKSPAKKIGLRPDDLIVRIEEYSVPSCVEFHRIMRKYAPGATVEVTFKRGTKVIRKSMTLAEAKQ